MALVRKAEALIRSLRGNRDLFTRTIDAEVVGGHNPIERGQTRSGPGGVVIRTVKKTLARVFGQNEIQNEVYASIQARGNHPNIVNVVSWDPSTRELVTADLGRYDVLDWTVNCRPKAKQVYHVFCQMLDMVMWCNSRGVFHRDLAVDNFVMKGEEYSDIVSQGDRPTVGLLDFGAGIVSRAVFASADPDSFIASYGDQWHGAATHGRRKLKDPFVTACSFLHNMGIGNGTNNYHLFDLYSMGKIMQSILDERGLKGTTAIRNLIRGVTNLNPTKRFHPSADLRQHEFMVRQKAAADGTRVGHYVRDEDIPTLVSPEQVTRMQALVGGSDAFSGCSKLSRLSEPAVAVHTAAGAAGEERALGVGTPGRGGDGHGDSASGLGANLRAEAGPAIEIPPCITVCIGAHSAAAPAAPASPDAPAAPGIGHAHEDVAVEMGTLGEGSGEAPAEPGPQPNEDAPVAAMDVEMEARDERAPAGNGVVDASAAPLPGRPDGVQGDAAVGGGGQADATAQAARAPPIAAGAGQSNERRSVLATLLARMAAMGRTVMMPRMPHRAASAGDAEVPRQARFNEPGNVAEGVVGQHAGEMVERGDAEAGAQRDVEPGANKRKRRAGGGGAAACEEPADGDESPEPSSIAGRMVKRRRARNANNDTARVNTAPRVGNAPPR